MFNVTVAGRIGQVREISNVGGTSVLNFSVATDVGFGDRKQTIWFDCALWGKRAESLQQYLSKGAPVTVTGEGGQREYEAKDGSTKTTVTIRVADIALQGKKSDDEQHRAPQQSAPAPKAQGGFRDDDVPFAAHERGWIV